MFGTQRFMKRIFERHRRDVLYYFLLAERPCLFDYIKLIESEQISHFLSFQLGKFCLLIFELKGKSFQ